MLNRKFTLKELPLVVNGDDILFRAINTRHYNLWKLITKICGLKFSLGKNYTSPRFMVINSELYKVTRSGLRQVPILNMRLLYGGTRSAVGGLKVQPSDIISSLQSAREMGEKFYGKYIGTEGLGEWKETSEGKLAKVDLDKCKLPHTDSNLLTIRKLRSVITDWTVERPERLEAYKKWFVTVASRQHVFRKQLKGDYKDNDDESVQKGVSLFRSRQIQQLKSYNSEFPRFNKMSLSNYLPRALGGLGLLPPPSYRYSNIDCAVVQLARENPMGAYALVQANHVGLVQSDLMACATGEVSRLCRELEIEPEFVLEDDLDEHKERYGVDESPFTGSYMRGFANLSSCVQEADLAERLVLLSASPRNGLSWKQASKFMSKVKARCARWNKEGKVDDWIPEDVDLNLHPERLLGGFWNVRFQAYPAMV